VAACAVLGVLNFSYAVPNMGVRCSRVEVLLCCIPCVRTRGGGAADKPAASEMPHVWMHCVVCEGGDGDTASEFCVFLHCLPC
jgi:hypothetical protein